MPRLMFFGSFRSAVSSQEIELAAATVREAFDLVWLDNPRLRAAMVEGETMRPYVRVLVNGRHIELALALDMPLAPEDVVAIFSPMAGGQRCGLTVCITSPSRTSNVTGRSV